MMYMKKRFDGLIFLFLVSRSSEKLPNLEARQDLIYVFAPGLKIAGQRGLGAHVSLRV